MGAIEGSKLAKLNGKETPGFVWGFFFITCRLPASRQGNCPHPFNVNPFVWFDVRFEDE